MTDTDQPALVAKNVTSKWWLAAVLSPILTFGVGIFIGFSAPHNQNDWLGMTVIVPVLFGLLVGCLFSCFAAALSLIRGESMSFWGVLVALPSLLFLIWSAFQCVEASRSEKRNAIARAESYKHQDEEVALMKECEGRLRANPELMTSDEFWSHQTDRRYIASTALNWILQDKSFVVAPELKAYVIKHFPSEARLVFGFGRSSHDELLAITKDKKYPYEVRVQAIDCLLRDDSFDVQDDLKRMVNDEFAEKYGLLFGGKRFTKSELEGLTKNPKIADYVKRDAAQYLQWGSYKKEAPK